MPRRGPCDTCDDVGLVLQTQIDESRRLVPCPDCRAVHSDGRVRYNKRPGFRCIRLPVRDMTQKSWCGRDIARELAFRDIDQAVLETVNRSGNTACPQCALAIRAALRVRL